MKKMIAILTIASISSIASVMVNQADPSAKPQQKSSMQTIMGNNSPMPLLMPILVKQSFQLALTDKQKQAFAKWRQENMAPAMKLANSIIETEKAIKQAAMRGDNTDAIQAMIQKTLDKRLALAQKMLQCRDNTQNILSQSQWQTLQALYQAAHTQ